MADVKAEFYLEEPPQQKRKMEASECSATASEVPLDPMIYWSDEEEIDPALEAEYWRQVEESDGFDIDCYLPTGPIIPSQTNKSSGFPLEVVFCARVGLHCYNIQKGKDFQFRAIEKYNYCLTSLYEYYITMEAMDPADNLLQTFQIGATLATCKNGEQMRIETGTSRLKPTTPGYREVSGPLDDGAIDDFYKGPMPAWLSDEAICDKSQYCYKVQKEDLQENEWLRLYSELAFFCHWQREEYIRGEFDSFIPLEIKKIVVETREDSVPPLKARNAIFYISFRDKHSNIDCKAIIRKSMDVYLTLEVNCWTS